MSDAPDADQKTEEPTQKRLDEARKRGEVVTFGEMKHAAMFAGILIVGGMLAVASAQAMQGLADLIEHAGDTPLDPREARRAGLTSLMLMGRILLVPFAILLAAAIVGGLAGGKPTIAWARVAPKWSKLSPVSGFKRIFNFGEFLKTLAKFAAVGLAAVWVIGPDVGALALAAQLDAGGLAKLAGTLAFKLTAAVAMIVGAIALLDAVHQRFSFMKRMRMTKQEVKDEHTDAEGDPHIKGKRRAIAIERSRRRMMADVPKATVVIANPTHFAVALQYEHGVTAAPVVLAKGVDAVALRIRQVAEEAGVTVVENPPLARALYATSDIGKPIPVEHYAGVAEVIGFVMGLRAKAGR
jgi:flagellar biosynthetic protein FlhB